MVAAGNCRCNKFKVQYFEYRFVTGKVTIFHAHHRDNFMGATKGGGDSFSDYLERTLRHIKIKSY